MLQSAVAGLHGRVRPRLELGDTSEIQGRNLANLQQLPCDEHPPDGGWGRRVGGGNRLYLDEARAAVTLSSTNIQGASGGAQNLAQAA